MTATMDVTAQLTVISSAITYALILDGSHVLIHDPFHHPPLVLPSTNFHSFTWDVIEISSNYSSALILFSNTPLPNITFCISSLYCQEFQAQQSSQPTGTWIPLILPLFTILVLNILVLFHSSWSFVLGYNKLRTAWSFRVFLFSFVSWDQRSLILPHNWSNTLLSLWLMLCALWGFPV